MDQRYTFAYIFAAAEARTDNAFALIMPEVNADAMQTFLDKFAETIPETDHVVMFLDRAGWHGAKKLRMPASITPTLVSSISASQLSSARTSCLICDTVGHNFGLSSALGAHGSHVNDVRRPVSAVSLLQATQVASTIAS